jgi:hypothetical protein
MQGTSWINLFRRIPVNLHDCLALTVTTGGEIILQGIVKLEPDFAIMRGRMAGTQDNGRVVILPYSQLVSIAFNRDLKEDAIQAIFGAADVMAAALDLSACAAPATAAEEAPAEDASVPAAAPAVNSRTAAMPSKSILLAKLRARLAEGNHLNGK